MTETIFGDRFELKKRNLVQKYAYKDKFNIKLDICEKFWNDHEKLKNNRPFPAEVNKGVNEKVLIKIISKLVFSPEFLKHYHTTF